MANRLNYLETENKKLKEQIRGKDQEIEDMKMSHKGEDVTYVVPFEESVAQRNPHIEGFGSADHAQQTIGDLRDEIKGLEAWIQRHRLICEYAGSDEEDEGGEEEEETEEAEEAQTREIPKPSYLNPDRIDDGDGELCYDVKELLDAFEELNAVVGNVFPNRNKKGSLQYFQADGSDIVYAFRIGTNNFISSRSNQKTKRLQVSRSVFWVGSLTPPDTTITNASREPHHQPTPTIAITIYANGLYFPSPTKTVLHKYPNFRDYDTPSTRAFLRDVLDGYWPWELRQEFPDGGKCFCDGSLYCIGVAL